MNFRKGEQQFLQRLKNLTTKEKEISAKNKEQIDAKKNNLRDKIHHTIEKIKDELDKMPEISREMEFHPDQKQNIQEYKDIVAKAIKVSLEDDLLKGFKIIRNTKNAWLEDLFHDTMADHFYNLLMEDKDEKSK